MKKLAIYFALMEEEKKLQNVFMIFNTLLFSTSLILLILKLFYIASISCFFILIFAIVFLLLQSDFILRICKKYANSQFKKLYLKHLEVETYFYTEKECKNFKKVRKNILIGFIRNNNRNIRKGFAYLKEWQENNLIMYEI